MKKETFLDHSYEARLQRKLEQIKWQMLHIDPWLILLLFTLSVTGLCILYSAGNQSMSLVWAQVSKLGLGFFLLFLFAQCPPHLYKKITPHFFLLTMVLLLLVPLIGSVDHGARRWLSLGFLHLQPSELMKISLPMMLAHYLSDKPQPPSLSVLFACLLILLVPLLLVLKQPDLGTAILLLFTGVFVIFLAGVRPKYLLTGFLLVLLFAPLAWHMMHGYQQQRVLTFLNPESDPLGTGYHIIQSKIAIGSGGWLGKGWLHGTQSRLSFLPTHTTDFIFAVAAEEWGFIGAFALLMLFTAILLRTMLMSAFAQTTYARLLSGSLALSFMLSVAVNVGMVMGVLPVVGVPLPLVSYGGSSIVTIMIAFGMIMSMYTHKKLWHS